MTQRVSHNSLPLTPPSIPQRDLRHDERFDVTEALAVRRAGPVQPVRPRIVSSAHGPIRELMLWYPPGIPGAAAFRDVYADLLRQLPTQTRVILVAHPESIADAQVLANERPSGDVELVEAPDWVAFSVWAEDACVVVEDTGADPPVTYLMEPIEFPRYGDALIAETVARATPLETGQLPLMFQGGNVLIGDTFVLVGRDYLDDSVRTASEIGAIEGFPRGGSRAEQETFVSALFRRTFDSDRDVHFLGAEPSVRIPNWIEEVDARRVGHEVERGRGERQPIFHIDMFLSLAGRDPESGRYRVLVGDPGLADRLLGFDRVPHDLQEEFDQIAAQLAALDFDVRRAPLPYVAVVSTGPALIRVDDRTVAVDALEEWYHPTSSNCLVQIEGDARDVWLPTYGHGDFGWLSAVDDEHKRIWTELGFTVHQLGDFHAFARNLGALHCIKKYLAR